MTTDSLLSLLVAQAAQLSIAIAIVALFSAFPLRRHPHLAYALWVVMVKAVIPPVWSSSTGVFSWALREPRKSVAVERRPVEPRPLANVNSPPSGSSPFIAPPHEGPSETTVFAIPEVARLVPKPAATHIQAAEMVPLSCLIGSAAILATIMIKTARLRGQLLKSAVAPSHPAAARLSKLALAAKLRIVITTESIGPALVGVLRPVIVIPLHLAETLPDRELRAIVAHETMHLRRGDHWVAALQRIVISIWWFNPLVWLAHWQINRTRELCCDGQTVAELNCDPADYAQMLLDVLRVRRSLPSNSTLFPGVHVMQITTKRLTALLNPRGDFRRRTPVSAWVVLAAAGLALVPGAGLVRTLAADAPAAQAPSTIAPISHPMVLHGSVVDAVTGKPIANATVHVDWKWIDGDPNAADPEASHAPQPLASPTTVVTDESGKYDLTIDDTAWAAKQWLEFDMTVSHPQYGKVATMLHRFRDLAAGKAVDGDQSNLDLKLQPCVELTGRVVGPPGHLLAGVPVRSVSHGMKVETVTDETVTNADGWYTLHVLKARDIIKDGAVSTTVQISPPDRATVVFDASGQWEAPVVICPAGSAQSGRVIDTDGKPVGGVHVTVRPMTGPSYFELRGTDTDADGRFKLAPLGPGKFMIELRSWNRALVNGYVAQTVTFPESGDVPPIEFKPVPSVEIRVKFVDPAGKPVAVPATAWVDGDTADGAIVARFFHTGPTDTMTTRFPAGVHDVEIPVGSCEDHNFVCVHQVGDGPVLNGYSLKLGTVDHDVTDIKVICHPRAKVVFQWHGPTGDALKNATLKMNYTTGDKGTGIVIDQPTLYTTRFQGDGWLLDRALPGQPIEYTAEAPGFKSVSGTTTLKAGDNPTIALTLETAAK